MSMQPDDDPGGPEARTQQIRVGERSLRTALLALGVDVAWADYTGAGGVGRIDNVAYFNSIQPGQIFGVGHDIQSGIEALLHTLIDARHPGWYAGEGGYGTFAWDLSAADALEHEHHRRRAGTDDEVSVHEGFDIEPDGDADTPGQ